jgi:phage tail sheath protein FI
MAIPIITGSPGVYIREEDVSQQDIPITTGIAAMVFAAAKGPLTPTLITSSSTFTQKYGKVDLSIGYGVLEGNAYLAGGVNPNNPNPTALWALRVVNFDAKYAGATIMTGFINPYPSTLGTSNSITGNTRNMFVIGFTATLATAASFSATITYSGLATPITVGPVTWSSVTPTPSHNGMMDAIVAALNAKLATIIGGTVYQPKGFAQIALNNYTRNQIFVYGPEGRPITITVNMTGQATNTVAISNLLNMIEVTAENPGKWANDIGINITNISTGVFQRSMLTFSGALATGSTVNLSFMVNNIIVTVPPVIFTTDNDTTLGAVATAIETAIAGNVGSKVIIPTGSTGTAARQITMTAPNAGPGVINLFSGSVTGGTAVVGIVFNETYAGQPPSNTFTLNVWQRGNTTSPLESFVVSTRQQLDGFGNQMFTDYKVNTSASKSQYIRTRTNVTLVSQGQVISPAFATQFANIVWLGGGNSGSIPTSSQIINAWNIFQDTETYRINLLINSGYTDVTIQQTMGQLGVNRMDCMALLDLPSGQQNTQDAVTYRRTVMNIDTSYAATYTPDVQVLDTDNDTVVYVPPSGFVAARYIYTDNKFATWWAPAGVDRGLLPTVLAARVIYAKGDRDQLDLAQLNALRQAKDGSGVVIWGDKTMQVTPSLLSAVNVRRLMIFVENTIAASLERNLFDQNTNALAFLVQQRIQNFLDPIVGDGIQKYLVLCNNSNNPGYFGDAGQFNVSVYIVPIRAIRTILLDAIITPSTISFNELIISGIF